MPLAVAAVAELVDASRQNLIRGQVAELVDALALGASVERRKGSSPFLPTRLVGMSHRTCRFAPDLLRRGFVPLEAGSLARGTPLLLTRKAPIRGLFHFRKTGLELTGMDLN